MVYTYKEALKKYKTRNNLKKALKNKEIYKIERGIYADSEYVDEMILYSLLYPSAVITLDTALYYYDLTDVIPDKVYLETARGSRTIKKRDVHQMFISKDKLNQGKVVIELEGNKINMYDRERLLIEFIRRRKSCPFDYYKEVINNYREIADELDMYKIEDYLLLYKNDAWIANVLQREVF